MLPQLLKTILHNVVTPVIVAQVGADESVNGIGIFIDCPVVFLYCHKPVYNAKTDEGLNCYKCRWDVACNIPPVERDVACNIPHHKGGYFFCWYTLTQSISMAVMLLTGLSRPPERLMYIGSCGTSLVCVRTSVLLIFHTSLSAVHSRVKI